MLTLVEFQMLNKMKKDICRLEYLPNLAAASIIGDCRSKGIKTKIVKGQTRYFKDVFINEVEELINLLSNLKKEDWAIIQKLGLNSIQNVYNLFKKEGEDIKESLKEFYKIAIAKNEEDYLNKQKIIELLKIKNGIFELYFYNYSIKKNKEISLIQNTFKEIKNQKPDIIAFSFKSNYDYDHIEYASDYIREVIKKVKEELNIPIIAAGPALSPLSNIGEHIFNNFKLDYYLLDYGKETISKLVNQIENGKEIDKIPNLYYKNGENIIKTEKNIKTDYNLLSAPDFSDFDLDLYFFPERILPIDFASVCYWRKCAFCHEIPDINYDVMNKEKFLEIITKFKNEYKTHFVEVQSTCSSVKQLREYMLVLKENNINNMYFSTLARLEKEFMDKDVAKDLYSGGLRYIMWGLESGSQKTLNRMNKGINLENVKKILQNFNKNKIYNMCYVMIGFPGETKREFNESLKFLYKNRRNIGGTIITPFNLFKNSIIMKNPKNFFIKETRECENNVPCLDYEVTKGITQIESRKILNDLNKKIESGKIKISKGNLNPLDQFYIPLIGGTDSFHHMLFYYYTRDEFKSYAKK